MKAGNLSDRQIMNRVYKDVCGFEIPKEDVQKIRESKGSPVYGEIRHEALNKLFLFLKLNKNDVFFDLGSGVGKVVLHAGLFSSARKAVGVELSYSRYQEATEALKRASIFDPSIKNRCVFINDDLMTTDLSSATVIYTCSTAFSLLFMKQVTNRLSKLKHDFRLVTLQDLPDNKDFEHTDTLYLDMTWIRRTPVYIYRRR